MSTRLPCSSLPWSVCAYPGPSLEQKRPPCRGSRVGSPAALGRFPLLLLPSRRPSPPRAPRPQGLPKTPRPRLPWSSPWTLAGPLEGAANGRATWAAGFGLAVQFAFSAKRFRMGNRPNRLTAPNGQGEPTLELPWSPRARTNADERQRPARGETPTLEPGTGLPCTSPRREGRKPTNQTKRTREPLRAPPREDVLGKSRRSTAYPQQIVTTRLLYCLQDRFAQLSRLQRI
jgi:hypothetical protein